MRAKVKYWLAPGLRSVELTAAHYVAQRFSRHWHTGFAVGVVTDRAQGFQAEGREWVVGPGDLIVLNPGQVHDGYALSSAGWSSRMVYVPEEAFCALAVGCKAGRGLSMRFRQAVVHSPVLSQRFVDWHALTEGAHDVRWHPLTVQLFEALRDLMQARPAEPAAHPARRSRLREQLFELAARGDAKVASLNRDLDLTRFGSWRRVKHELGLAPKPLLGHLRLMSAKQMLASGHPVIEAALGCGYHDQSHFSRQFAAAYGFTPAQFRNAHLA